MGSVDVPNNWYINGTPGDCLLDAAVQFAEREAPRELTLRFMARHRLPGRLDQACGSLIQTEKRHFPELKKLLDFISK